MRKLIDIEECSLEVLRIEAVKNNMSFKAYIEKIINEKAKRLQAKIKA